MTRVRLEPAEALAAPLYVFSAALVVLPIVDLMLSLPTLAPGNTQWRFGASGVLSGNLITPATGIATAFVIAAVRQHRIVLRMLAILSLCIASALVLILAGFSLDILQLQRSVSEQLHHGFVVESLKAVLKYAAVIVILFFLGFRGLRVQAARREQPRATSPIPIVTRQT